MATKLYEELGLKKDEYNRIIRHLRRRPNHTELAVYSLLWSEHCAYKHSRNLLKTLPTEGRGVLQGPGENAGVVDIGGGWAIAFKMESHNHPSAIEPFNGAATGVGGIVRDILSMGARPIALLDSLRFGNLGKPRARYLMEEVVAGIAHYGNCIGVPTVGGEAYFDESYEENPLVNVMCVGLVRHENIRRGKAEGKDNLVLLIGAKTGRDGIGGASILASQEFDEKAAEKRPSVQVGDPFVKKLLIEACLELGECQLVVGLQDLGAAGLSSALADMASRSGQGVDVEVGKVPLREPGMEPWEVMISESQERMLAVITPSNLEAVQEICNRWGLLSEVVGKVTSKRRLRMLHDSEVVGEIPIASLNRAPSYKPAAKKPSYLKELNNFDPLKLPEPSNFNEVLLRMVKAPNICSRRAVYEQYDHMVQTNTTVLPGSDAAVLRIKGLASGIAMTTDGNGRYCFLDPYRGAVIAVAEAARNLATVGAKPLALTDCLNFGNPEKPDIFWQFSRVLSGLREACTTLRIPIIGGNVSFYNESLGQAIYPTPVVGMVGRVEDVDSGVTAAFKEDGSLALVIGETKPELGGSEYLSAIKGTVAGRPPDIDLTKEAALHDFLRTAVRLGLLLSAHDLADGGLGIALAESALLGDIGGRFLLKTLGPIPAVAALFGESQSRALVSLREDRVAAVKRLAAERGLFATVIGDVGGDTLVIDDRINLPLDELKMVWEETLESGRVPVSG